MEVNNATSNSMIVFKWSSRYQMPSQLGKRPDPYSGTPLTDTPQQRTPTL